MSTLLANDTDLEQNALSLIAVGNSTNGVASVLDNGTPTDPTDDVVQFIPALDFSGTGSFEYTLSDKNSSETATGLVTVAVGTVQTGSRDNDILDGNSGTYLYLN